MGDPTHIIELIDQILEETADRPDLQDKIFDLRDALLQAQQSAQQYNLKIKTLEETIRQLKLPAHRIGTILGKGEDNLMRLNVGGTEYQAAVSPEVLDKGELQVGDQVAVNEGFVAIAKLPRPERGPIARIVSRLDDGHWLVGGGANTAEAMVIPAADLRQEGFKEGDEVVLDPTQKVIIKRLPKRQAKALIEDDYVKVSWEQVGGQENVIEEVRKVIEYPILHEEILNKMEYRMPKGFLFYGPPGCGKTLIGKAILSDVVAQLKSKDEASRDLEGRFIHVKGPEILNMWLGESERKVREIFKRARDYREKGKLPFIFIDEAESVLGTRQALRVNNISNTLVPMFCAEMDGIQSVRETVVILATNRPDLIDPAILRPGRIDRKIKVGRPNREDCEAIMKVYLKPELPVDGEKVEDLIHPFIDHLFKKTSHQEALTLTLRNGEFKKLYWKDFISGAILEGIILRAKEKAIERAIAGGELKIRLDDLIHSLETEFNENSVLPADSNMEDWLQLLDFDPKNVARVRRPNDSDQAASDTLSRSII
ncbi:MAG: AAA family ATPase [Nitrospinaceae bacterium]|nr:AAA family ATPase [Nitrospinaceae bacterium]NIR53902.1 AAA family ATPase [Nitrospinaceae bacterium]NIS84316.1 AAA family ATPase [Nitrospinaceae bacterium]NIT81123.1 AAA family ATPase [Nitrospinaceae bacterium]NIU43405.1 AAA family ATPase [Nitrospinaceae bacterium]